MQIYVVKGVSVRPNSLSLLLIELPTTLAERDREIRGQFGVTTKVIKRATLQELNATLAHDPAVTRLKTDPTGNEHDSKIPRDARLTFSSILSMVEGFDLRRIGLFKSDALRGLSNNDRSWCRCESLSSHGCGYTGSIRTFDK